MKRKGFTLIELLAVIVILAIIALIATPIILGIVEDARKDSFLRSVELVIKATDIDIFNKEYNDTYTYTITDGNIPNLEVGVKNTDGMNGSITYDKNGNDTYAIHNGKYCVIKTEDVDKAEIKDYEEGECMLPDDRMLTTLTSKVPSEGDAVSFTNGQLINLGKYGIRYQGKDPDNYVYFNCTDQNNQNDETCELWRIIGIVDGKVKIMKNESIGEYYFNEDDTSGNDWTKSELQVYLNNEYYENLNSFNKTMIENFTWSLKGHSTQYVTKSLMYDLERETGTLFEGNKEKITANIGLIYPSDFGYAAMENESCLSDIELGDYEPCANSNWMVIETYEWTITPYDVSKWEEFMVDADGYINAGITAGWADVRPTIYLSSNVKILEGEGNVLKPYQLTN